jgi:hypothetical protein
MIAKGPNGYIAMLFSQWFFGIVTGVVLTTLAQWVAYHFRLREEHRHRLADIHSQIMGVVSDDLQRANSVKGYLDIGFSGAYAAEGAFDRWIEAVIKIDTPRHDHRKELARLTTLLEVFERDKQIVDDATLLCESQPFFFHQPFSSSNQAWQNSEQRREQERRYDTAVDQYAALFTQLRARISAKYR